MAVENLKTTSITNLDATPIIRANPWVHGGNSKQFSGTVEVSAAASIASTYRFFRVGSWMRPVQLRLFCDALTAGAIDIGLARTAADGGAYVDQDFFASAVALGSALNGTDVTYEAATAASMDIANIEKRIWEVLALTSDPNLEYDVVATVTTAITATGTVSLAAIFSW